MNFFNLLFLFTIAVLLGCSDSSSVASDEIPMEAQNSSSSLEVFSLSEETSSSSVVIPHTFCAPKYADAYVDPAVTFIDTLIRDRISVLISLGVDSSAACDSAKLELYKSLGLDSISEQTEKKYGHVIGTVLMYFFDNQEWYDRTLLATQKYFADNGDIGYCDVDDGYEYYGYELLENDFFELDDEIMGGGCVVSSSYYRDSEFLQEILDNILRKCSDLPYCDSSTFGMFSKNEYQQFNTASLNSLLLFVI